MRKIVGFFIVLICSFPAFAQEQLSESDKIAALLDAFSTSDITFIRNGEEHDGKYAREHLEAKLKETKDINTGEDFISKVASTSKETGKPYLIKLKDGTQIECAKWLRDYLKQVEDTELVE